MWLIDAEKFFENLIAYAPLEMVWNARDIAHKLNEMPKIDAEPVRHAEWLPVDTKLHPFYKGRCSYCGKINTKDNYCPNCGAKMTRKEISSNE